MKKIVLLVIGLMMVASVAFGQPITAKDLAGMKGTWVGVLTWGSTMGGVNCPAELVIKSDKAPVSASLTIDSVPDQIAQMIGAQGGKSTMSNDDGKITTSGSLMFAGNKNFIEFFLKHDRLDGWFYYNGARGDIMLKKK